MSRQLLTFLLLLQFKQHVPYKHFAKDNRFFSHTFQQPAIYLMFLYPIGQSVQMAKHSFFVQHAGFLANL